MADYTDIETVKALSAIDPELDAVSQPVIVSRWEFDLLCSHVD